MYIVEVKERKQVKVGERLSDPDFQYRQSSVPIFEERVTLLLRQEVEELNLQELVKLINKII